MMSVRPSVRPSFRPSQKQRQDKILATTGAMRENNENLLAVAWWVILNSLDSFSIFSGWLLFQNSNVFVKTSYQTEILSLSLYTFQQHHFNKFPVLSLSEMLGKVWIDIFMMQDIPVVNFLREIYLNKMH